MLELYQGGSEGPQWWATTPDDVRGLPANGILVRCQASGTCPRVFEPFGSAEVWALKLTPEWVGTNADTDIPLPANVRSYYIPSTTHGGTVVAAPNTMFNASLPGSLLPPASCPGNNYGTGVLSANPVPHTDTVNALLVHFRDWVMHDIEPPPCRYPTLRDGNLVEPIKEAMGFPTIPASVAGPGWPATVPEPGFINPVSWSWCARPGFGALQGLCAAHLSGALTAAILIGAGTAVGVPVPLGFPLSLWSGGTILASIPILSVAAVVYHPARGRSIDPGMRRNRPHPATDSGGRATGRY